MKHAIIVPVTFDKLPDTIAVIAPLFGVALFALPSYYGVLKQRKVLGLVILVALGAFALAFETLALKIGVPYGDFSYTDALGSKLLGTTPWIVALAYPPILLVGFWFASKFTRSFARVILTAVFATMIDLVLDPATVKLEFWMWDSPGPYFGVPIINFVGWLVSGFIGGLILHALWGKSERVKAPVAYSGLAVLLFWTGVNAGVGQLVPFGIGILFSIVVLVVLILEKQQFKNEHSS